MTKISELDPLHEFTPTLDLIPVVHAGKTYSMRVSDFQISAEGSTFLPTTGGYLTGPLYLYDLPTFPNEAATKGYVDSHVQAGGPFLPISGGQMLGNLSLVGDPQESLDAASKSYVDSLMAATASGGVTVMEYTIKTVIASGDPGTGAINFNVSNQSDATALYIDQVSNAGRDWTLLLMALKVGQKVSIQPLGDHNRVARWTIAAPSEDMSGYTILHVTPVSATGFPLPNNTTVAIAIQGDTVAEFLPLSGGTMQGGISFGQRFGANLTDLTQHISLYDGWGGFNVTGNSLNMIAGSVNVLSSDGSWLYAKAPIYLPRTPIDPWEAAPKNYIDTNFAPIANGGYVMKTGDQMTGALYITSDTDATIRVIGTGGDWPAVKWNTTTATSAAGYFESQRYGKPRWSIEFGTGGGEPGGNVGTDYIMNRFDDDGNWISPTPFVIRRGTGAIETYTPLYLMGDPTTGLQAVPMRWVTNNFAPIKDGGYVAKTGDVMTGPLSITGTGTLTITGETNELPMLVIDATNTFLSNPTIYIANMGTKNEGWWPGITFDHKKNVGLANALASQVDSVSRWVIEFGDSAYEAGGNTGTNFTLFRCADDGGYIAGPQPLHIERSTGQVTIGATHGTSPLTLLDIEQWNAPLKTPHPDTILMLNGRATGPNTNIEIVTYGGANIIRGYAAEGSPGAVRATGQNRNMLIVTGSGYDGAVWQGGRGAMWFTASENWTPTANGTQISWRTTRNGQTAQQDSMLLSNAGALSLAYGGLSFGNDTVGAPQDTSRHINLYNGFAGFSVTGGTLNIVSGWDTHFVSTDGTVLLQLNNAGDLELKRDPVFPMHAVNRGWIETNYLTTTQADARFVNVTGDQMSGPLAISASGNAWSLFVGGNVGGAFPAANFGQYIGYNVTGGGEASFVNSWVSAQTSFQWWQMNAAGNALISLATLGPQGNFAAVGNIDAGSGTTRNNSIRVNSAKTNWPDATSGAGYSWLAGGSQRWFFGTDGYPNEDGSDVGTALTLHRYGDDGRYLGSAFNVDRKVGKVYFQGGIYFWNEIGADFGGAVGANNWDVSKHIRLHYAGYGISVTSNRLNYVAPASSRHEFVVNTADVANLDATGLHMNNLGISLGEFQVAGDYDLSKHILLYDGAGQHTYGLNVQWNGVNPAHFNYVAGLDGVHQFLIQGTGLIATFQPAGLLMNAGISFGGAITGNNNTDLTKHISLYPNHGINVSYRGLNVVAGSTFFVNNGVTIVALNDTTVTVNGGMTFGNLTTPSSRPTDLTRHLSLFGGGGDGSYGFSITANRLNIVSPVWTYFNSGGNDIARFDATGLTFDGFYTVTLGREPTADMEAATRKYADGVLDRAGGPFLPLTAGSGMALTGMLYLPHTTPTVDEHATPLFYVRNADQVLQDQISAVAAGNLVFYGQLHLNAAGTRDEVFYKTMLNLPNGPLPDPTTLVKGSYFIVVEAGIPPASGTHVPPMPAGTSQYVRGDWFISDGEDWIFLPLGLVYFTASAVAVDPPVQGTYNVQDTLQWFDANDLKIAGGTMQGHLYLDGIPTTGTQAASKDYVDNKAFLKLTGGVLSGGLSFGSEGVPSGNPTDLSRHIALWGTSLGFSVTGYQLNYVTDTLTSHVFYVGGGESMRVNSTGLKIGTGNILTLARDPQNDYEAATKHYVDVQGNAFLKLTGGTMLGDIQMSGSYQVRFGNASQFIGGGPADAAWFGGVNYHMGSWNGIGMTTSCGGQFVPPGIYGIVFGTRDGNLDLHGQLAVHDSRNAVKSQIQTIGFFNVGTDQTIEVNGISIIPSLGSIANGGGSVNVNDRFYDDYGNIYTALATSGGQVTDLRMDSARATIWNANANPVPLHAIAPSIAFNVSVNINWRNPNRLMIQHTNGVAALYGYRGTQLDGGIGGILLAGGGPGVTVGGTLWMQNGLDFNYAVSGNPQDTSRGITFFGPQTGSNYGIVVTGSTLNYNVYSPDNKHDFWAGGNLLFRIWGGDKVYSYLPLTAKTYVQIDGVPGPGANAQLVLNATSGGSSFISAYNGGSIRWQMFFSDAGESGVATENGGSNFVLNAFRNDGAFIGQPMWITRGGDTSFTGYVYVGKDPWQPTSAVTLRYLQGNYTTTADGDARWVNVSGDEMHGQLVVSGTLFANGRFLFNDSNGGNPWPAAGAGYLGWNSLGWCGEVDFVNGCDWVPNGAGFDWKQIVSGGGMATLATLRADAILRLYGLGVGYPGLPGGGNTIGFVWTGSNAARMFVDGSDVGLLAGQGWVDGNYLKLSGGTVTGVTTFNATTFFSPAIVVSNGASNFQVLPSLAGGSYNGIVQTGDVVLLAAGPANDLNALTLTAWSNYPIGIRIDAVAKSINMRADNGITANNTLYIANNQNLQFNDPFGTGVRMIIGGDKHFGVYSNDTDGGVIAVWDFYSRTTNPAQNFWLETWFQRMTHHGSGLSWSGGDYRQGSVYTDGNWGTLIRGLPGNIADVAFADRDGNIPLRIVFGNQVKLAGPTAFVSADTLTLGRDPSAAMEAVPRQYVEANFAPKIGGGYVAKSGDVMSGGLGFGQVNVQPTDTSHHIRLYDGGVGNHYGFSVSWDGVSIARLNYVVTEPGHTYHAFWNGTLETLRIGPNGVDIRSPDTSDMGQLQLRPSNWGSKLSSKLRFYGSFDYAGGDYGPRMVASLRGGYEGGAWYNEHLDVWITNQVITGLDTDAMQTRVARFTAGMVTIDRDLTVTGHAGFRSGIDFNPNVVTNSTDLSKHVDLYAGVYGFSVSNDGATNHVSGGFHNFYVGGGGSVATFTSALATIKTNLQANGIISIPNGGIDLVNGVSGPYDSSRGITFWGSPTGPNYSIVVSGSTLNYNVNNVVDHHDFNSGQALRFRISDTITSYMPMIVNGNLSVSAGSLAVSYDVTFGFNGAGYSAIYMNAAPNTNRITYYQSNGKTRWLYGTGAGAESGGNVGSDFFLAAYNDAGTAIHTSLYFSRATGLGTVEGDPTAPLGIATKQYTDNKFVAISGGNYVKKDGDTMTGSLTVNPDITASGAMYAGVFSSVQANGYPQFRWTNTAAGVNLKKLVAFISPAGDFTMQFENDASSQAAAFLQATRSGYAVATVTLTAPNIYLSGVTRANDIYSPVYRFTNTGGYIYGDTNVTQFIQDSGMWRWEYARATGQLTWMQGGTNLTLFQVTPNGALWNNDYHSVGGNGIIYRGFTGNAIAFNWDSANTCINQYIDGSWQGTVATRGWAGATFKGIGAYTPNQVVDYGSGPVFGGVTITGDAVTHNVFCDGSVGIKYRAYSNVFTAFGWNGRVQCWLDGGGAYVELRDTRDYIPNQNVDVSAGPTFSIVWLNNNGIVYSPWNGSAVALPWDGYSLSFKLDGGDRGRLLRSFDTGGGWTGCHQLMLNGNGTCGIWWPDNNFAGWTIVWSDRRLKSNIRPATIDALGLINRLTVHELDLLPPVPHAVSQHWDCALIADEVEEVIPLAVVNYEEGEGYAQIREMPLIATMARAIQQLTEQNVALMARMEQLEQRMH
jgi:hypothetical protein